MNVSPKAVRPALPGVLPGARGPGPGRGPSPPVPAVEAPNFASGSAVAEVAHRWAIRPAPTCCAPSWAAWPSLRANWRTRRGHRPDRQRTSGADGGRAPAGGGAAGAPPLFPPRRRRGGGCGGRAHGAGRHRPAPASPARSPRRGRCAKPAPATTIWPAGWRWWRWPPLWWRAAMWRWRTGGAGDARWARFPGGPGHRSRSAGRRPPALVPPTFVPHLPRLVRTPAASGRSARGGAAGALCGAGLGGAGAGEPRAGGDAAGRGRLCGAVRHRGERGGRGMTPDAGARRGSRPVRPAKGQPLGAPCLRCYGHGGALALASSYNSISLEISK